MFTSRGSLSIDGIKPAIKCESVNSISVSHKPQMPKRRKQDEDSSENSAADDISFVEEEIEGEDDGNLFDEEGAGDEEPDYEEPNFDEEEGDGGDISGDDDNDGKDEEIPEMKPQKKQKLPEMTAKASALLKVNTAEVKNAMRRSEIYNKQRHEKKVLTMRC